MINQLKKINLLKIGVVWSLLLLGLTGCGGDAPETNVEVAADTSAGAAAVLDLPVDVDVNLVEEIRHRDDVVLVDVREGWEYDER